MEIGSLFLGLGLKGSDKVVDTLKGIRETLAELAAKAPEIDLDAKDSDKVAATFKQISEALKELSAQFKVTEGDAEVFSKGLGKPVQEWPKWEDLSKPLTKPNRPIAEDIFGDKGKASKALKDLFNQKPPEKTTKALKEVGDGLKGVTSMSFGAKAAILGAMYAFEQLFAKSNAVGTSLQNFGALTGIDTKTLQQYQYAARQVGVSNEEVQETFESLQSKMTQIKMGLGTPSGWGKFAMTMGLGTTQDVEKFMKNPELLLQKLQEYSKKEKDVGVRNQVVGSFVGKGMAAALAENAFRPDVMSKAPVYGDKEIKGLAASAAMWRNLGTEIEMAVGHFNSMHGAQIEQIFRSLVDIGLRFASVLLKLAEKLHIFEILDSLFKALDKNADSVISTLQGVGSAIAAFVDKYQIIEKIKDGFSFIVEAIKAALPYVNALGGLFLDVGEDLVTFGEKNKVLDKIKDGIKFLVEEFKILMPFVASAAQEVLKFATNARLVENIKSIILDVINIFGRLGEIIIKVGKDFHIFEGIAAVLSGAMSVVSSVLGGISSVLDKLAAVIEGPREEEFKKQINSFFTTGLPSMFGGITKNLFGTDKIPDKIPESALAPVKETAEGAEVPKPERSEAISASATIKDTGKAVLFEPKGAVYAPYLKLIVPQAPVIQNMAASTWAPRVQQSGGKTVTQDIDIKQDLHFPTAHSPKETGDHVKKAVNDAFRQMSAQAQGS